MKDLVQASNQTQMPSRDTLISNLVSQSAQANALIGNDNLNDKAKHFLEKHPICVTKVNTNNGVSERQFTPYHHLWSTGAQLELCDSRIDVGRLSLLTDDECPSLGLFRSAYGILATHWMITQLDTINVMSNSSVKMSEHQTQALASIIFNRYYYLNLSHVCLFMGRLCSGCYPINSVTINPIEIGKLFHKFAEECKEATYRIECIEEQKRKEDIRSKWREEAAPPAWVKAHVDRRILELTGYMENMK